MMHGLTGETVFLAPLWIRLCPIYTRTMVLLLAAYPKLDRGNTKGRSARKEPKKK